MKLTTGTIVAIGCLAFIMVLILNMQLPPLTIAAVILVSFALVLAIILRYCLHEKLKALNNEIEDLRKVDRSKNIEDPKKTGEAQTKAGGDVNDKKNVYLSGKPKTSNLINNLTTNYDKASEKLENVNTIALIDSEYKKETIFFNMHNDWVEGITRTLPSLLIAFGLIGTFVGITQNLTGISTILAGINENNLNSGKFIGDLEQPLSAMGIAFKTSLVGLTLGSVMTIVNTCLNTSIAKNQLFASLEDYLDNSYNKGDTRLNKAVERMVQQQEEFLTNFHNNVAKAVKDSLGEAAKQISNAAGNISTGATTFESAANSLQSQNQRLSDLLRNFRGGVEIFQSAATQLEQNNIVQNIDRVIGELNTSQQAFTNSTQTLESSLVGITSSNQTAAQLAQSVYRTLQTSASQMSGAAETIGAGAIIFQQSTTTIEAQTQTLVELMPQLRTGVESFVTAANTVQGNNIIENLDTVVANLSTTQQAFADSSQILADGVQGIMIGHQEAIDLAQQVYDGLEMSTTGIQEGANIFLGAANIIHDSSLAIDLTAAANSWQTAQAEFAESTAVFSQAAQIIQPVAAQLEPAIASIDRAVDSLQQFSTEVVTLSQNTLQVSESTQATVSEIDRNHLQYPDSVTYLTTTSITKYNYYD